jgi:murein DD-endopeptidase MepM/ murein hydrolase activator NlpD
MNHQKVKLILSILLGICMLFIVTAEEIHAEDLHAMTQQLLLSGQVNPELAARVNSYTALYQVKAGETLWEIATRYGIDHELIAAMNFLPNNYVKSGQILVLPIEKELVYTVQKGDILSKIAKQFGVTVNEIAKVNGIVNPNILYIGQELVIPGGQNAVQVSSNTNNTRLRSASTVNRGTISNFLWPVQGRISSPYGPRSNGFHHGLDIAAPQSTPIKAARGGVVEFAGWLNVYGRTVIINHGNGYQTLYAHNSSIAVKEGQSVNAGQTIAKIGSTGNATGPHVHFEIIVDGNRVDPLRFLRGQ